MVANLNDPLRLDNVLASLSMFVRCCQSSRLVLGHEVQGLAVMVGAVRVIFNSATILPLEVEENISEDKTAQLWFVYLVDHVWDSSMLTGGNILIQILVNKHNL